MGNRLCPKCGQEYSDTYRNCPFCEEEEAERKGKPLRRHGGKRLSKRKRSGGAGGILLLVMAVVIIGVVGYVFFGEEIAVHAKIVNFQGLSSHADRDHLLAWIADIKAPKPQHVFIVHGDREVAPYFAESVEKLGFTAHAPQYTEVYDLIEDQIVAPGYLPERKAKAVGGQRVSSAYERLVALGQRMVDVIRRSKGRDNKTLGRWADQLRQLLDKWEES